MGTLTLSPGKYGDLQAKTLPKVIENDREPERFAETLEALDRLERKLTPEEDGDGRRPVPLTLETV